MADTDIDIKQEILASLREQPPAAPVSPGDTLHERFTIQFQQRMQAFDTKFVTTYAVRDAEQPEAQLNVAIANDIEPRPRHAVQEWMDVEHPNLIQIFGEGTVAIPGGSARRYAIVYARPTGTSVLEHMKSRGEPFAESVLLFEVVTPLATILKEGAKRGIRHGRVHISNLYISRDKFVLGEGATESPGDSNPFVYDSLEQLLTQSEFKGESNISADCYALGVLVLQLMIGPRPLTKFTKEQFIQKVFEQGSYQVLTQEFDFSPEMQDFFRGVFQDNPLTRWDPDTILKWASGKRFHILNPPAAMEATRPFQFLDGQYWSRRSLAEAMFKHWDQAAEVFFNDKLQRWADMSLRKPEVAEAIGRVLIRLTPSEARKGGKPVDDGVMRMIQTLDPTGPLRLKGLALYHDSLGKLLYLAMRNNENPDLMQAASKLIEGDVLNTLQEILKDTPPPGLDKVIKDQQRIRAHFRSIIFGGGPERCLYDLNPDLPCQSPKLLSYHITGLAHMLEVLDALSATDAGREDILDRHGAAFLASKLNLRNDPRVTDLLDTPTLATDPKMISLNLIMQAAKKTNIKRLPGITHWLAVQLAPIIERVHNRSMRTAMQEMFLRASKAGNLQSLAGLVFDPSFISRDEKQFRQVEQMYNWMEEQIQWYRNPDIGKLRSARISQWFSQTVSFAISITVIYSTLKHFMLL